MKIQIPKKVNHIIQCLTEHGFEAYAVGGCVRDALLGRTPEDWDITTSAKPEQVKALFRRTIDTGIQHGTVTVMLEKEGFEVTTYRIDGEYEDSRHPKQVEFTASLLEDLKRRDFTINAMAYNEEQGIIDEFHGMDDLKQGIIRCVGDPMERFQEDALRMLRAIRFAGQLEFEIEENTKKAIRQKTDTIANISAERIRVELDKLLCSKNPMKFMEAYELGITKIIFPEFNLMYETEQDNPHHIYNVGTHSLICLEAMHGLYIDKNYEAKIHSILSWTALLHDVAKPDCKTIDEEGIGHFEGHPEVGAEMTKDILKRLRFDNYTIDIVTRLVKWHDYRFHLSKKSIRRAVNKIGEDIISFLFLMERADVYAQSEYKKEDKLRIITGAETLWKEIEADRECIDLKDLEVNGRDLLEIGCKPGPGLGILLKKLLEKVLEDPHMNEKEFLLKLAMEIEKE